YADNTQLILSFPPSETGVVAISQWMSAHHLKLNLDKTEMLFLPGKGSPVHDLTITIDHSVVTPSRTARNLGVILDDLLSFSANIDATTPSCRYTLYNIRRIRPLLTQKATQILVQALLISRLDYFQSLLAGLPSCAIRPLQLIQNAAARLVFNLPKCSHTTPLLRSLHWLPVAARIRFKTQVLAYRAVNGSGPSYIQDLVKPYTPTRYIFRCRLKTHLFSIAPRQMKSPLASTTSRYTRLCNSHHHQPSQQGGLVDVSYSTRTPHLHSSPCTITPTYTAARPTVLEDEQRP
ncbi:uncharacterized protein LOC117484534, partial [Trematomus bernacchii]|uniref:uncharacterized protein LOC117484534 n=1 Tax=Trematomus bernacchii TaxID=40690 RepID=UPI00146B048D